MSGVKIAALLGCCMVVCARAATAPEESGPVGNPYQGIIDRNVFALKPPTPPPKPEENRPPPPKILLTGITTILGKKLVLLKVQTPAKPGAKAEEQSMTLTLGQRQDDVEVLEIDEKNGIVKVNDYGTITNLTWEANGIKVAAAPTPQPAVPGAPVPGVPQPNPGAFNPGGPARAVPTGRSMRTVPGTGGQPGQPGYGNTGYNPAGTALTGLGGAASPITGSKNWPPEVNDPDHQTILDAVYKQQHADKIARGDWPDVPGDNPLVNNPGQQQPQPQQNQTPTLPRSRAIPPIPNY